MAVNFSIVWDVDSITEGDSGETLISYTVIRDEATATATVEVSFSGTSTSGSDYADETILLGMSLSSLEKTGTVAIQGDVDFENDESLIATITNVTTVAPDPVFDTATDTLTILNDDPGTGPTYSIAWDIDNIAEGDSGETIVPYTLTRDIASHTATVEVSFSGTAIAGTDYADETTLIGFPSHLLEMTGTVAVQGDVDFENDETLVATIADVTTSQPGATIDIASDSLTILNDDPGTGPAFSIAWDVDSITEGDSGETLVSYTITRDLATATATVEVGFSGTAITGSDYADETTLLGFPHNLLEMSGTVAIQGDVDFENDESLIATITDVATAAPGATIDVASDTLTILNDDPGTGPSYSIAWEVDSVTEGDSGETIISYTVTRDIATVTATVDVSFSGTAFAGVDYTDVTEQLHFSVPTLSRTRTVTIQGDVDFEDDESIIATIANVDTSAPGSTVDIASDTLTILNDDPGTGPSFSIAWDVDSITEGDSGETLISYTVTRELSPAATVHTATVEVSFSGAATAGVDYTGSTNTHGFSQFTTERSGTLAIQGDVDIENDESLIATITNVATAAPGATIDVASDTLTILNDDGPQNAVEGTGGDDVIDLAYTGDPEGDVIDGGDNTGPGHPDDDIVDAFCGDDVIDGAGANDTIYAGGGSDTVTGGAGHDVIFGDENLSEEPPVSVREVFQWDLAPDPNSNNPIDNGDDLSGGFSQNTGIVDVSFSVVSSNGAPNTKYTDRVELVTGIDTGGDPIDATSGMRSSLDHSEDNAEYAVDFSQEVSNVSFRVNDIDYDGVVQIQAFDESGDPITVNLTGGSNLTLSDTDGVAGSDEADSKGGGGSYEDESHSILVDIPGPVARIVITHSQDGSGDSGVGVTDIYFDVVSDQDCDPGDDVLFGGDGDDVIYGNDGDDTIHGGDGSDTVFGGENNDVINTSGSTPLPDRGFPGHDIIPPIPADGNPHNDRDEVDGGAGDDLIVTGDDDDTITGGSGEDTIDGGLDDDTIDGGDHNDFIVGGEGADSIDGGDGNDTIYGGLDPIFPDGLNIRDDGSDGAPDPDPTNGMDVIDGGEGNDVIYGQDDDDDLSGGIGNDYVDGGIDEDTISGGTGEDTLLGGHGDDVVSGDEGNDILIGGEGADELFGGDDSDWIGAGVDDVVTGGEGGVDEDYLVVSGLATVEYEVGDPEAGTVSFYDDDLNVTGTMEFSEIEHVLVVSPDGGGFPGVTAVDGVVEGTGGADFIDLVYSDDPEGDMVDSDDAVFPLTGEQDIIRAGAGDDTVTGLQDSDIIFGEEDDDSLDGGAGNDGIDGGSGNDTLIGGAGTDILVGGEGNDRLSGGNTITGDSGDLMFGNEGDDTFVDIGQGEIIDGGEDDLAPGEPDDEEDILDLTGAAEAVNSGGSLTVENDPTNSENGTVTFYDASGAITGTTEFFNIETITCFTPGTLIATPKGERRVEDLKINDRVITRDNGVQEIRWVGHRHMTSTELSRMRHLRPVLIRAGALGSGLPERDMMVSPNHRVLVANEKTALYFGDQEVLAAAKHLTGIDGVEVMDVSDVIYIHFMFNQHEVVLSDGSWTESFQPGEISLKGLGNAQRNEVLELFPELKTRGGIDSYHSVRRSLKKYEAELLTF